MTIKSLLPLAALAAWSTTAAAGYGDVDQDGYPNWAERNLHLWTNAVRVEPDAFDADYQQGGCKFSSFKAEEKIPHAPFYYDRTLNDAARFHTDDMYSNNWFAHESSDGTSFGERLARFYMDSGYVGENIAYGYPDTYIVVTQGWMCSSGHRANIMNDYNEMGAGVISDYYTQDFGTGTLDVVSPVAMGSHEPEAATGEATFYVDWQDTSPPAELSAVVDGRASETSLEFGTDLQGVYAVDVVPSESGCHEYYFRWETSSGASGTFPETGSYLYGSGCENDLMWTDSQRGGGGGSGGTGLPVGDGDSSDNVDLDDLEADVDLTGCSTAPSPASAGFALLAIVGLALRRRRQS